MPRTQRAIFVSLVLATAAAAACKKKPEPAPAPAPAPPPAETCDRACQDSIARAREDSARRAREEAERLEREARERATASARAALDAKVYFEYDASDLSAEARAALDGKLPVLRANPQLRLRISGHADERGSDEYNLALGQRRAAAAKRYLTDQGVDAARLDIVSYGEERPAAEGQTEEAYRQNRRAEFEIVAGGENLVVPQ
jgi:peptidoglycan-associated lipoprotein